MVLAALRPIKAELLCTVQGATVELELLPTEGKLQKKENV